MIEQLYIERIYRKLSDIPNIIRGATKGDLKEIKEALQRDPNCINEVDAEIGVTALHIAAFDGNYELVDFLCSQPGIDVYVYDKLGRTQWIAAQMIGREDICDRIMHNTQAEISQEIDQENSKSPTVTPFRRPSP